MHVLDSARGTNGDGLTLRVARFEDGAWQPVKTVVTNDTGMSHLAAAVGTRSVVVFSVTDPRRWKPAGDRHRAVIAGELHSTIAAVLAALPS